MKVNIDMENLDKAVQTAVSKNIEKVISTEISKLVQQGVDERLRTTIEEMAGGKIAEYIDEYIKTATVTVGGGFYSDGDAKTYTVEEYVKDQLALALKDKKLSVKDRTSSYSDRYVSVTFEEYIKKHLNIEGQIKKQLDSFLDGVRKQINNQITDLFESGTQDMLSDAVFNVLMQNDTYANLSDSIKRIADKSES